MKNFLAVASMLVAMAAVGSATTCGAGGAVDVMSIGSCTVGGLTFSNFQVSAASAGPGTALIDLVGVTINGNDVILNFNPNLGLNSEGLSLTDLHFTFTVTGPLIGADADTSIQSANLDETICSVSNVTTSCSTANTLFAASVPSGSSANCVGNVGTGSTSICHFGTGVNTAYVFKDISIAPGGSLSSFNESFLFGFPSQ